MTEYSRMVKGSYTVKGGSLGSTAPNVAVINLPFKPDFVELINYTQAATPAQHGIPFAYWDASVPPLTFSSVNYDTVVEIFNATPVLTTDMVKVGGGISAFSGGLMLQYGPTQQVIGITKAAAGRVNVTAHGYSVGDTVIFQGLATGVTNNDFRLINGIPFTIITVSDADHFDIVWNTNQSNYTALSGSPTGALVKKVLYPFLYLPEDNVVSAITAGNTTTVATTMYHNFEPGQEIAFRIPALWGMTQLNSLPNVLIPGQPVYGYVVSITDNWTFVCNINSSAFTAFTTNPVTPVPGNFTWPQVLSVGDVNTGGLSIYTSGVNGFLTTSPLYPSPNFPTSTNRVPTINGPGIKGSFANNTSQGFIVGNFHSRTDTTSWVGGSDGDIMQYRAFLHDLSSP
jgi:hypothetical protein